VLPAIKDSSIALTLLVRRLGLGTEPSSFVAPEEMETGWKQLREHTESMWKFSQQLTANQ